MAFRQFAATLRVEPSVHAATMSSSCKVCVAKRAGLAPPKRKCSCDSGITVQRDRKSACAPAANELVGGQIVTALGENPKTTNFWSFDDQITTASQDGDLAVVQSLLASCDVLGFAERYARSLEWLDPSFGPRLRLLHRQCDAGDFRAGGRLGEMQLADCCFTVRRRKRDSAAVTRCCWLWAE